MANANHQQLTYLIGSQMLVQLIKLFGDFIGMSLTEAVGNGAPARKYLNKHQVLALLRTDSSKS